MKEIKLTPEREKEISQSVKRYLRMKQKKFIKKLMLKLNTNGNTRNKR